MNIVRVSEGLDNQNTLLLCLCYLVQPVAHSSIPHHWYVLWSSLQCKTDLECKESSFGYRRYSLNSQEPLCVHANFLLIFLFSIISFLHVWLESYSFDFCAPLSYLTLDQPESSFCQHATDVLIDDRWYSTVNSNICWDCTSAFLVCTIIESDYLCLCH